MVRPRGHRPCGESHGRVRCTLVALVAYAAAVLVGLPAAGWFALRGSTKAAICTAAWLSVPPLGWNSVATDSGWELPEKPALEVVENATANHLVAAGKGAE